MRTISRKSAQAYHEDRRFKQKHDEILVNEAMVDGSTQARLYGNVIARKHTRITKVKVKDTVYDLTKDYTLTAVGYVHEITLCGHNTVTTRDRLNALLAAGGDAFGYAITSGHRGIFLNQCLITADKPVYVFNGTCYAEMTRKNKGKTCILENPYPRIGKRQYFKESTGVYCVTDFKGMFDRSINTAASAYDGYLYKKRKNGSWEQVQRTFQFKDMFNWFYYTFGAGKDNTVIYSAAYYTAQPEMEIELREIINCKYARTIRLKGRRVDAYIKNDKMPIDYFAELTAKQNIKGEK